VFAGTPAYESVRIFTQGTVATAVSALVSRQPSRLREVTVDGFAGETKVMRLGRSRSGRVLMVAYTFRKSGDAEAIRIISARRASRRERAAYAATD
jgi:uncharacterized DUF497 family protein